MSRYNEMYDQALARDGRIFVIRPVGRADAERITGLFHRLGPESRRRRYLAVKPRLSPREVAYLTAVDHESHAALAALDDDGSFIAVARYALDSERPCTVEVAVEVADEHQGRGIGSELVRRIVEHAGHNGYRRVRATMLWENARARALFKAIGFRARGSSGGLLDLELELPQSYSTAERTASSSSGCRNS